MDKYLKSALSQTQAEARGKLFTQPKSNISYNLFLKTKKGDSYEGDVIINFELQKVSSDLFLDYAGTNIHEITINGNKLATTDNYESLRDKRFLNLPTDNVKEGKNEVRIKYSNLYSNDGYGLHSFTDTDDKQYLYSQCEAFAANKVLPCFDQPDLKATLTLTMAVPTDWVAVSNQPATEEAAKNFNIKDYFNDGEEKDWRITSFSTTPRLSTYLFVFIAGPFQEIKCNNVYKNITMSCYCRESLMQYMKDQAEEVFEITIESIKFYESYFNYPYPFEKYDSVFCPEYKFGAMEHPGAVTFNDRYVWREKVTAVRNSYRVNTIAHEAAHMWFGDLVTMRWWNDLWLNESFADYISHYCMYKIQDKVTTFKFPDVWLAFFSGKGWGYEADQQSTTHPIAGDVLNTDQAESIFDGITYSKGAGSLKQLMNLIGEEGFGKAMSSYFKKFEWSNATLSDFIASLNEYYKPIYQGSPASLEEWKAEWLTTAGLNEVTPVWDPKDTSANAKLTVKQSVALQNYPTLRHHKMKIAFFDGEGKVYESKDVMLNNTPETVIEYDGSKQPKAILLNYQDEAFIKIRLDEHSITFLKEKVAGVPDELTRAMIWRALFDMVRDGQLSGYNFINIVVEGLPKETSDTTLSSIYEYIHESLDLSPKVLKDNVLKPKLWDTTLKVLLATDKSNTNRIVSLRNNLLTFASIGEKRNVDNISRLAAWFDGKDDELKGIELDDQNKWTIVNAIHNSPKFTNEQKESYFKKVAEVDSSDRMKLAEQKCIAQRAEGEERKKLFQSYLDTENKLSVQMQGRSMCGYNESLLTTEDDHNEFFDSVLNVFKTRNNEFARTYYSSLFPKKENLAHYVQRVSKLLEEAGGNDILEKCLKESLDDMDRKKKGFEISAPDVQKEQL